MAIYKLEEFYPDYRDEISDSDDIKNFDVYADEKVGHVQNIMVNEEGQIRYLVVDTGIWVFGKQVLLPIGLARIDYSHKRVNVPGLTKQQVESLPEFSEDLAIDRDYETQVRDIYRPLVPASVPGMMAVPPVYDYRHEPYFESAFDYYDDPKLKRYEESLIGRRRAGSSTTVF